MHQTPANNKLSRKYIVSRLHLAQAVLHHNLHPPLFFELSGGCGRPTCEGREGSCAAANLSLRQQPCLNSERHFYSLVCA